MAGTLVKRAIDERLLDLAGKGISPEKIAKELNNTYSAMQVRAKIVELLEADDWLSIEQKKQLALRDIYKLKDLLMEEAETNVKDVGGHLNRNLILLTDRLDVMSRESDEKMMQFNQKHASKMFLGIRAIGREIESGLMQEYPEIDQEKLFELLQRAVERGIEDIQNEVEV